MYGKSLVSTGDEERTVSVTKNYNVMNCKKTKQNKQTKEKIQKGEILRGKELCWFSLRPDWMGQNFKSRYGLRDQ